MSCKKEEVTRKWSDQNEYGFKGQVKSVFTKHYEELKKENSLWVIDENKLVSKQKIIFNSDGNIDKIIESRSLIDSTWHEETTTFIFKDGIKKSHKKMDLFGVQTERASYKWLNDKSYKLKVKQTNGLTIESISNLNSDFRNLNGEYKYFLKEHRQQF